MGKLLLRRCLRKPEHIYEKKSGSAQVWNQTPLKSRKELRTELDSATVAETTIARFHRSLLSDHHHHHHHHQIIVHPSSLIMKPWKPSTNSKPSNTSISSKTHPSTTSNSSSKPSPAKNINNEKKTSHGEDRKVWPFFQSFPLLMWHYIKWKLDCFCLCITRELLLNWILT